jgi:hypothetical protein
LSLSDFFSSEMPRKERAFFPARELIELGDAEISYRQVGTNLRGKPLQILWVDDDGRGVPLTTEIA